MPKLQRPSFKQAMKDAEWKPTSKGHSFGPSWSTHWFKIQVLVPTHWKGQVIFNWDSEDEGFVYSEDGIPVVGLSGQERKEYILPDGWKDGNWHLFYIETSCNYMSGDGSPPDMNKYFRLNRADLVWPNLEARALFTDFWIIGDAAREFPNDSWQKHKARNLGNQIMNTFDPENVDESIAKCRKLAQELLGELVDSPKVFNSGKPDFVYAIGNCHIDTAWLWPFGETHRKVGRSWASQLDLLERYPEYRFVASQMQQFKWLSEDYPDLFARIKKAVIKGNFIPIGGSWVEHDTNMPGGESMVRQFLLGQRFLEQHFGFRTRTFWLPDSFGYSPQVPQFCRGVGIDRFLTQKLSWNNVNKFPHTSFNWVALDGSQVLVHMPPGNTYTARAHFGDVKRSLSQHRNLDLDQKGLLLFGHGDGGGGPTAEMLEKLRRCRGLSDNADGLLPRVQQNTSVDEFYDKILSDTSNGKNLTTWNGEMYLEYHRGTYTTQALIKKGNRMCEALLHDLELAATLASLSVKHYEYPKKEIDRLWQDVCLNQFHDVLPGSSIEMVYEDARPIHRKVLKHGRDLLRQALEALGISDEPFEGSHPVGFNSLPWKRGDIITVDSKASTTSDNDAVSQLDSEGNVLMRVESDGTSGVCRPVSKKPSVPVSVCQQQKGTYTLDNGQLRVVIVGGALTSIWDYTNKREVLDEGRRGNQFVIYDDQPLNFPAWDTELYSLDNKRNVEDGTVRIVENGPIRASVQVEQKISSKSSIKTTISLDVFFDDSDESAGTFVEFSSVVEWHETYKFLKVEFPVDVRSDYATYETSYGAHRRPTHYNTTWDVAKFEVCGHRWADLSDMTYGVSILNDCKYGYSIHGNLMTLSLLRSPKSPDAHADMGTHTFRYALMPHKGPLNGQVIRTAYNFNHPMRTYYTSRVTNLEEEDILKGFEIVGNEDRNLVLANVKRFEDDVDVSTGELPVRGSKKTRSVIIRVYDSLGGRSRGTIRSPYFKVEQAFRVNHLEDEIEELDVDSDGVVDISLRAYEIASYKLVFSHPFRSKTIN